MSKLSFGPDDEDEFFAARSVKAFVEFMSASGRLQGGAARAARLMTLAEELAPDALAAMGDESKFGMAKSMFGGIALEDLPESPDALRALLDQQMEEFNALPFDERRRKTDRFFEPTEPDVVDLPFVHVPPSTAEIDRSARDSPVVAKFGALCEYLGASGRVLTPKGNFKLADARALVDLLDTGDEFDPTYEGHVDKTRSSEQLAHLTFLLGMGGGVQGSASGEGSAGSGEVVGQRSGGRSGRAGVHDDDRARPTLDLPPLLVVARPDRRVARRRDPALVVDAAARWGGARVRRVRRVGPGFGQDARGRADARMGVQRSRQDRPQRHVRLTPLGHHVVPGQLPEIGYRLRSIPDLATASATDLLDALALAAIDLDDAVSQWQPDTPETERARLLVDAVVAAGTAQERLTGFSALRVVGPEAAAPFVRQLLDTPVAGHAALFLLDAGVATDAEVGMFLDVGPMVDILSTVVDEPDALCELFSTSIPADDAMGMITAMWRHPQPETLPVLESLGRHLPDRHLAKAARKAVMQHRSWMASRGEPVR